MLTNYLKIALRHLQRHKGYSFINVAGLAVGMACCLLILLYVQDEVSYDGYHDNGDRIFRVANERPDGERHGRTPHPLAPALTAEFPEVEAAVRFRRVDAVVRRPDEPIKEENFYCADAAVFDVFSFPFLEGDPSTALAEPYSLVLTEATARKYFGAADPLGQTLTMEGLGELTVTGVLKNIPSTSHFTFDALASYATLEATNAAQLQAWDNFVTSTYLLLADGYEAASLNAKLASLAAAHLSGEDAAIRFYLDPLPDLHLYAHVSGDLGEKSDARQLYIFSSIAVLILLIACVNFMSLTTARSAERAREVGLRKVLGVARRQLMGQFLGESMLLAGLALALALLLVEAALPAFNGVAGKTLTFHDHVLFWVLWLGMGLGVGLLAGSYPAFAFSAFRPADVLRGQTTPGSAGARLRQGLVVAQFGLAVVLITGALVTSDQLAFLRDKNLGFDKEQVVVLSLQDQMTRAQTEAIKDDLLAYPNVVGAAAAYHTPGRGLGTYFARVEGIDDIVEAPTYIVDYDFVETLGLEIVAGRAFSEAFATDAAEAFLVNETAVRQFGWTEQPVGKIITWDGEKQGRVVGVVKDFHFESLHRPILPLVMHVDPGYFRRLAVRIRPAGIPATLAFLKQTMARFDPTHPFEYTFLDEDFASHYRAETRLAFLVRAGALLAILVACLGLLGLASFSTQRRTKEIGVRKVLGASVPHIMLLLSKDFTRLVLLGFVAACPIAYLVMNRWLDDFAYRVDISWRIFLVAGLAALGIAWLTVSYQSIKAALADPVKALRYE